MYNSGDALAKLLIEKGLIVIAQWKRQLIKGAVEVFNRSNPAGRTEQELTGPLYEKIGRLKMEVDWLKKTMSVPIEVRRDWIAPEHSVR